MSNRLMSTIFSLKKVDLMSCICLATLGFFFQKPFYGKNSSQVEETKIIQQLADFQELENYHKIWTHLEKGELQPAHEKIQEFKKNFPILTYENNLAAIESFLEYKDVRVEEDSQNSGDSLGKHLQAEALSDLHSNVEVAAYCLYLSALKLQEEAEISLLQKKFLKKKEYMVKLEAAEQAFQCFKRFIQYYPEHPYVYDVKRRMNALYQRLANAKLLQACAYFIDTAYVGCASCAMQTIQNYPQSTSAIQALLLLAYTYQRLEFQDLADNIMAIYRLNRNQLNGLSSEDSVKEWFSIVKTVVGAECTAFEAQLLPYQKQLRDLEIRGKSLEDKMLYLQRQQMHTLESALETQQKLGVIREINAVKKLLNNWLEFQINRDYKYFCDLFDCDPKENVFSDMPDQLSAVLKIIEDHLSQEEKRLKLQEQELLAFNKKVNIAFFDKNIEQQVDNELKKIEKIELDLVKNCNKLLENSKIDPSN